jgi:hypothetical protein
MNERSGYEGCAGCRKTKYYIVTLTNRERPDPAQPWWPDNKGT